MIFNTVVCLTCKNSIGGLTEDKMFDYMQKSANKYMLLFEHLDWNNISFYFV